MNERFAQDTRGGVRGPVVSRTHRVVRERALKMEARRRRVRSLWIPVAVCSALVMIVLSALWAQLDQYSSLQNGATETSNQFLVVGFWFLPLTLAVLGVIFVRRSKQAVESEASR